MLRRTDNACWGFPGGALEPGEALEETARRETYEETGLRVTELSLLGVISGPELYWRYPNGDEVYIVTAIYSAHGPEGTIDLADGEHTEYAFFDLQAIPTADISPPSKPILRMLGCPS